MRNKNFTFSPVFKKGNIYLRKMFEITLFLKYCNIRITMSQYMIASGNVGP